MGRITREQNSTWNKEIGGLLQDGFMAEIFKGRKNIYEISFTKRNKKPFKIEGISYMACDFTQKQLKKILDILKEKNIQYSKI